MREASGVLKPRWVRTFIDSADNDAPHSDTGRTRAAAERGWNRGRVAGRAPNRPQLHHSGTGELRNDWKSSPQGPRSDFDGPILGSVSDSNCGHFAQFCRTKSISIGITVGLHDRL
jgi:hypothetical protein